MSLQDAAGRLLQYQLQPLSAGPVHEFEYDTLGQLRFADDPDIGKRFVEWDEFSRIEQTSNEVGDAVNYMYDFAGRLTTRTGVSAVDSSNPLLNETFTFHYDAPSTVPSGETAAGLALTRRTIGRLAEVTEPNGGSVISAYDAVGRTPWTEHTINGVTLRSESDYSASGLMLEGRTYTEGATAGTWDERVAVAHTYDKAARLTSLKNGFEAAAPTTALWDLVDSRAGGEVLAEDYGNGLSHLYQRDVLGQVARFTMSDVASCGDGVCSVTESNASCAADCTTGCGNGTCDAGGGESGTNCPMDCGGNHIDLAFKRAAWGAVLEARDVAPSSLTGGGDFVRSAAFTYDGAARLTAATIGGKKWDTGPGSWDTGSSWDYSFSYAYDATQNMTQRTAPSGVDVYAGDYAYAGGGAGPRQLTSVTPIGGGAGQTFSYDVAGRQLERIDNTLPVGQRKTTMLYDPFDRVRVVTRNADSGSPDVITHWYGYDGERIRTEYPDPHSLGGEPLENELLFGPGLVVRGDNLELVLAMGSRPIARLEVAMDASAAGEVRWLHQTFGPGPSVVSDENGQVVQDRLYAPFGTLLTARDVSGASTSNADLLLSTEPLSWVNKEVDRATTWSDHGARWYAARTGRWLSPDPPVKGPDDGFLISPWDAHPYKYGKQSPTVYWDPDGKKDVEHANGDGSAASNERERAAHPKPAPRKTAKEEVRDRIRKARVDRGLDPETGRCPAGGCKSGPAARALLKEVVSWVIPEPFSKLGKLYKLARWLLKGKKAAKAGKIKKPKVGKPSTCFARGTLVSMADGTKRPIEQVRVGDRVVPGGGFCQTSAARGPWFEIRLRMYVAGYNADGSLHQVDIIVLRPTTWIRHNRVETGSFIRFAFDELPFDGPAEVLSSNLVGEPSTGEGCLVTMTVTHLNPDVRQVEFVETGEVLRATGLHKLWSLDRADWVRVADLTVGERLGAGEASAATVSSIGGPIGSRTVYNLEVDSEHSYRVGNVEVWSHNTGGCRAGEGRRRANRLPDRGTPDTVVTNTPGTTTKKYGPDGWVQKEHNKGHNGSRTPPKERRDHIHDYKPNPRHPEGRPTRQPGREPRKRDLQELDKL